MHEQFKMDKWQKCGSVGCKTHSSLGYSNTYFNAANEHGRYFAEMAHLCRTDEISHSYFAIFRIIHTISSICLSPPAPRPRGAQVGTKEESNDSPLWKKKKEKKYFLESFVLGGKNRVKNRWMKPGFSAAVASASPTSGRQKIQWLIGMLSAAARYEKKSVGSVINHSAERGGEDLMKRDKRTWLESTQRSLVQRLEYLRVLVTVLVRLKAGWLFFKSEPPQLISQQTFFFLKRQAIHFNLVNLVLKFRSKVQRTFGACTCYF